MHRQDNAMPDVHVHVLPSGVTVLILPRPGAPLVSLGVFQRSGAAVERAGQEGLMRLAAQAMLKGTTTRTGAAQRKDSCSGKAMDCRPKTSDLLTRA